MRCGGTGSSWVREVYTGRLSMGYDDAERRLVGRCAGKILLSLAEMTGGQDSMKLERVVGIPGAILMGLGSKVASGSPSTSIAESGLPDWL